MSRILFKLPHCDTVLLEEGRNIRFTTVLNDNVQGRVLGINHDAVYPIKVEFYAPSGEKRINSFKTDEFIHISVEV